MTRDIRGPGITLTSRRAPFVMGILNVTPDSFSDGGLYGTTDTAVRHGLQMATDGAHILDIGGESSRPGADGVSVDEELSRVVPVIEALRKRIDTPISIDTRRAAVAAEALDAGCCMVNDISACGDPEMPALIRQTRAPVVVMHMRGEPKTMQVNPTYDDVVREVTGFLLEKAEFLKQSGIEGDRIILDPGIGFGKRFRDNLDLIGAVAELRRSGYPVLIGASRKAFLGELLDAPAGERLSGSLAVAAWCHRMGADIVRVHDVKETVGLFRVLDAIEQSGEDPA